MYNETPALKAIHRYPIFINYVDHDYIQGEIMRQDQIDYEISIIDNYKIYIYFNKNTLNNIY